MLMSHSGRSGTDRVLLSLLALSLFVNVAVLWVVSRPRAQSQSTSDVAVGSTLPELIGAGRDGARMSIDFTDSRPLVLYVFSPTCKWCERNTENIVELARKAGTDYRFVALSLSTPDAISGAELGFPVMFATSSPFRSTPQTLLIGKNRKVERVWTGAYAGTTKVDIEAYFQARLPGLVGIGAGKS
jgi:steroid 5-alpha reductase family enzyme